jgi:hypothetical protein
MRLRDTVAAALTVNVLGLAAWLLYRQCRPLKQEEVGNEGAEDCREAQAALPGTAGSAAPGSVDAAAAIGLEASPLPVPPPPLEHPHATLITELQLQPPLLQLIPPQGPAAVAA